MATPVNTRLRDAQIDHAVNLRAYSDNVVRRIIAILNRADAGIFTDLVTKLAKLTPERFTIKRLEVLLESVRRLNVDAYAKVDSALREELQGLTHLEVAFQSGTLAKNLPPVIDVARIDLEQVYAGAMARPFQGGLLSDFIKDQEAYKAKLIRRTIADGYVQNRTTDEIVRQLRGTKALAYRDGILEVTRREAAAIARTAISHTSQFAKDRVAEANADILSKLQWLSTLDGRTTPECQVRDNKTYTLKHDPIDHEYPWGAGPGRLHWQCRSTYAMITKSWKDFGIDAKEFTPAQRASMDGSVPADTDYADWLKRQSPERQDSILGPTRGALLRDGKLTLDDMRDTWGKPLTLEQLRALYTDAFKRAGL